MVIGMEKQRAQFYFRMQTASCLAFWVMQISIPTSALAQTVWDSFELNIPEPTIYWVDTSAGLLTPSLRKESDTLQIKRHPEQLSSIEMDRRLILHLQGEASLEGVVERYGLNVLQPTRHQGVFVLQADTPIQALAAASNMRHDPDVLACYPVEKKPFQTRSQFAAKPDDPYYERQWHLEQRDSVTLQLSGVDLNVRGAWPMSQGEGVRLAVVDTGVDLNHPDLSGQINADFNHNFINGSRDGNPMTGSLFHGTAVAGLIGAAAGNQVGITGVAPGAELSSWVIFGLGGSIADSLQLSEMYETDNEAVPVQNHSWGNAFPEQEGPSFLERLSISNAFHHGRSGKGIVMVRAGGNDRNSGSLHPGLGDVNDDGYTSMHTAIAVAAVDRTGRATTYSNWGAALLVAAPGGELDDGLFTTDVLGSRGFNQDQGAFGGDYIPNERGFIGTSAAAPLISGLAGLALSVNPDLSARDVQQILLASARHVFEEDPDLVTNAAGFRHSHNVGFGIPDAAEVVRLARTWVPRGPLEISSITTQLRKDIPNHGLRLKAIGDTVPDDLKDVPASTTMGIQPDVPTGFLEMSFQNRAIDPIADDLTGKGALVRRGTTTFDEKIRNAANAGAQFVVIYNHQLEDELIRMAGTDYTPLPAFFISREHGEPLSELVENDPSVRMQLEMNFALYEIEVKDTFICEHVELIVDSDHTSRGQLRIVLESPSGTRSVLQRLNFDQSSGPLRWAYRTTRHFYEPTAGIWKVYITDQDEPDTGAIRSMRLTILGTEINDSDDDGLDDGWEQSHFGNLDATALDDPDEDGSQNAREQLLGTHPLESDFHLEVALDYLDEEHLRLSWPSRPGKQYEVRTVATSTATLQPLTVITSHSTNSEWILKVDAFKEQFFQVTELAEDDR